jgi:hypothetical protein
MYKDNCQSSTATIRSKYVLSWNELFFQYLIVALLRLRSSWILRSISCWLHTEVSRQSFGPIFKGRTCCPKPSVRNYQLSRVTSQKSEDLNYTAAEALNPAVARLIE